MVHASSRVKVVRYNLGCQMKILSDLEARAANPFTERVQQVRRWLVDAEILFVRGSLKSRTAESEDAWLSNIEIVVRAGERLLNSLQADIAKHEARDGEDG